jgi:hypothetical protein
MLKPIIMILIVFNHVYEAISGFMQNVLPSALLLAKENN